jgi:uncharacterized protein (TIGR02145 family)
VGGYLSATKISFTGTPMYEIALAHPSEGHVTVKSGDTFLLPCASTLTSFTDATGAPGIFECALPTLSGANSPSRCSAGTVQLTVTADGGMPSPMTYTWTIGGTSYTNQSNSYTISLSFSTTYTVKAESAPHCASNTASGQINVNGPGEGGCCPYTGSDLYNTASYLCRQRSGGAQNWEAYIKDKRDDKRYRIVKMPDNNWWLAQNVKYAVGLAINGCTEDECGRAYTWAQVYAQYDGGSYGSSGTVTGVCPPGWHLPVRSTYNSLISSIGSADTVIVRLRPVNFSCSVAASDYYGWASIYPTAGDRIYDGACYYTNDAGREDGLWIYCHATGTNNNGEDTYAGVRCFKPL